MVNDRDEEGRFSEKFSTETFIKATESLDVASTQNVADHVGCSYDLAYRRLKALEEDEVVVSEKVGGAFVWLSTD